MLFYVGFVANLIVRLISTVAKEGYEVLVGWEKNMRIYQEKRKYNKGERWKNGEKEIFFGGKNIIFEKGGGGKNTLFRVNIHPWTEILKISCTVPLRVYFVWYLNIVLRTFNDF